MKKSTYLMIALLWGVLSSCNNNTAPDSKDIADSVNEARVDSAEEGTVSPSAITVSEDDAEFATDAADGGIMEVELGTLAQTAASDAKVKEFGTMMIEDHSKVNEELKALAQMKNITLPAMLSIDKQKIKEELSKKTGKDFDKAYVDLMVKDHKEDVKEFEEALEKAKDPDIKAFIVKTLPTLKAHLSHIEGIEKQRK